MVVLDVSPCADTYADVEQMLNKLAWHFSKSYGMDFDECKSEANYAYMMAYENWDSTRGCLFSTHVYNCAYYALQELRRTNAKISSRAKTNYIGSSRQETEKGFDCPEKEPSLIMSLVGELDDDAKIILRMFLETPGELAKVIRQRNPSKVRAGLWKYMKECGWSMGQYVSGMENIKEALQV